MTRKSQIPNLKSQTFGSNRIAEHVVSFGRVLRRAGLESATSQIIDAMHAIEVVGVRQRRDVYQALFSVFVTRRDQVELFDQAFHLFWRAPSKLPPMMSLILPKLDLPVHKDSKKSLRVQQALAESGLRNRARPPRENEEKEAVDLVMTYSATELLRKKDFAEFSVEEVLAAKQLIAQLQWPIAQKRTRRRAADPKGGYIDLSRTLRRSMKLHGEVLKLKWQGQGTKMRDIAVLCDISGSMERYSRMLLHFLHAITNGMRRVETFVFGTRLTHITRYLRQRDIDEAVSSVSKKVVDWAGGTRIGESLRDFNYVWARRVLRSSGVVLVISDGWDRGDIPLLDREVARLARNCSRLIWLNPLLGYKNYEPLTRGIRAALPHVDNFLPVHNLESLEQLGEVLTTIQ